MLHSNLNLFSRWKKFTQSLDLDLDLVAPLSATQLRKHCHHPIHPTAYGEIEPLHIETYDGVLDAARTRPQLQPLTSLKACMGQNWG